ncbi:zinc finger protein ZFP2-like [Macrobrachium nipponense]|uniref:zinc finger protein ZFP2-like n=1 Tax=Macrobrachium nipponense TaxID=159736 RepID=UPI0030C7E173
MDLSRKTIEDNPNRVNAGQEYPVNIYKKRKTFLSHINTYEELPLKQQESVSIVSKPEFEKGCSSNADCFSQSHVPITEDSRNDNRRSSKNTINRSGIWAAALPSDTESTPSEKGENDEVLDPLDVAKEKENHQCVLVNKTENKGDAGNMEIKSKGNNSVESDGDLSFDEVTKDFIDSSSSSSEKDSDDGNEWFTCKGCEKVFFARKAYTNHRRSCNLNQEQNCPFCKEVFTKMNELADHVKAVHKNDKPFLCDICGKTFPNPIALNRHMLSHTKVKSHSCKECGKSFACQSNLRSHVLIHSDEKPFQCEECGNKFRRSSTLRFHKRTHTNERPYQCDVCGKTFTQPSSLKTHQKLHSGERPHACNVCNEKFALKAALQSHMRTHTKEKPFSCELCHKSFTQSSALKIHLKKHENVKTSNTSNAADDNNKELVQEDETPTDGKTKNHHCELCGRCFALKNTLKIHMMRHRGERPHKCDVCPKSFTQSSTLKIHKRIHTGDKPYACSVCDAHFAYNYALQKHILKHKEAGEIGEEEFLEQGDCEHDAKLNVYGEEVVGPDPAALEEMKQKILQTLSRTDDKNIVKQNDDSEVKHEESIKNVNSEESDHGETNVISDSGEDQEKTGKRVTPMDFLAVFQSSFKASPNFD